MYTWPIKFIEKYPSNSAVLECIGLLAPFVTSPKDLQGKNILLEVDNITCCFGWQKRNSKTNESLAILIQTLHIFEAALPCRIFIEHVKRRSTNLSKLVDNLSRSKTTYTKDLNLISNAKKGTMNGPLVEWIANPSIDWKLPLKIVQHALDRCK